MTVLARRTISLVVVMALLLSLVAPIGAAAATCGEAGRARAEIAAPSKSKSKGHGCVGCTKKRKAAASTASISPLLIKSAIAPSDSRPQAMLCCNEGETRQRAVIDVPTLVPTNITWSAPLLDVVDAVLSMLEGQAAPTYTRFKIGASPPYLAALQRHTYLRTSAFLI